MVGRQEAGAEAVARLERASAEGCVVASLDRPPALPRRPLHQACCERTACGPTGTPQGFAPLPAGPLEDGQRAGEAQQGPACTCCCARSRRPTRRPGPSERAQQVMGDVGRRDGGRKDGGGGNRVDRGWSWEGSRVGREWCLYRVKSARGRCGEGRAADVERAVLAGGRAGQQGLVGEGEA